MLQFTIQVYEALVPADGWYWIVTSGGKCLDSGKATSQILAARASANKVKQWADAQP